MRSAQVIEVYRRYGPILFSHFFRQLGDESEAIEATRAAFATLVERKHLDDETVVRWIRTLER